MSSEPDSYQPPPRHLAPPYRQAPPVQNGPGPQPYPTGPVPQGQSGGLGPRQQQPHRVGPPSRPASGAEVVAWRTGQPASPPHAATGLAMKRRNPVGVWLGRPLITLGIYSLVWYYKIHREMAEFDPRRAVPVAGPLLVLLFLGWTVVAPLVSFYNTGRRIADAQRGAGLPVTCSPAIGVLLCFVVGLQTLYYQIELNKIVDAFGVSERTPVVLAG